MAVTSTRLRADEYLAQADEPPRFRELIDGKVVVNAPSSRHQELLGFIYLRLVTWTGERRGRGHAMLPLDVTELFGR